MLKPIQDHILTDEQLRDNAKAIDDIYNIATDVGVLVSKIAVLHSRLVHVRHIAKSKVHPDGEIMESELSKALDCSTDVVDVIAKIEKVAENTRSVLVDQYHYYVKGKGQHEDKGHSGEGPAQKE